MISVHNIHPDFEQEVEFLNLSNLALSCPRSRAHIDGLKKSGAEPTYDVDRCSVRSPPTMIEYPNTCEEDPECFRHVEKGKFVCSSKSRRFEYADVPEFRHRHVVSEVQTYRQLWCIEKDSATMNLFFISSGGRQIPIMMYCRIIQSVRTGIVYVMFSSGIVFAGPDVLANLRDYSLEIIQQVKGMVGAGRICICGHSMGATVSMAVAYHWFKEDTDYFMEHVNVIALGSINLFKPGDSFTNLPNIRSYLSAVSIDETFVDPFCIRGDISKTMYSPVKLILSEVVEVDVQSISFTSSATLPSATVYSRDSRFEVDPAHNELHNLDITYIPTLLELCKRHRMGGAYFKRTVPKYRRRHLKSKRVKKNRYSRKLIR